jgi:hypothetical protein
VQLLRAGFDEEALETGRERLLLTAAVAAEIDLARQYYQVPQMARSVSGSESMTQGVSVKD